MADFGRDGAVFLNRGTGRGVQAVIIEVGQILHLTYGGNTVTYYCEVIYQDFTASVPHKKEVYA